MLFSSASFIFIFLPIVLLVYYAMRAHRRTQNVILCLFSLFFYAWGEPWFVLVMIASIIVNWSMGLLAEKYRQDKLKSRTVIIADLVFNLAILFVFKYLAFLLESINRLLLTDISVPDIALPIGISFFTFQAISYVLDVHRGRGEAQHSILNVALYISFFPQLIAGPIVRYETIAAQLNDRHENINDFSDGVVRFIIGLGKKVIIANNLAPVADQAFSMAAGAAPYWMGIECDFTSGMAWLGAIAYTLQIFFDFSGYSDMAIGLGRMFGFRFLENFNYPYISASISEFWRRWHISLGTWFRDYLYIPLGGSRCSESRNYLNLFTVWFCTGLWHGASWNFVVWGLMYFVLIAAERYFGLKEKTAGPLKPLGHIYTLLFVILGWVIFRADNLQVALEYITEMFSFSGNGAATGFYTGAYGIYLLLGLIASVPVIPFIKKKFQMCSCGQSRHLTLAWDIISAVFIITVFVISISFIVKGSYNPFIYFNF